MKKIDAFPHILTKTYFERMSQRLPGYAQSPNVACRPALFDLDARFHMMDRYPDYVQILTLSAPPIEEWAGGQTGLDLAVLGNDEMAELVEKHPDRFVGFAASVMLDDVDASLDEIDRAVGRLGALGVQIFTNVKGHPLDEPRFEPFFAKMAALDKPVWVHPTRTAEFPDYPSETASKYGLWMKFGWPYETSIFMSRLVFSGIMDRYPRLRILTHHAGGIVPHLAGRLVLHHELPEMRKSIKADDFDEQRVLDAYRRFYGDTVFSGAHHPLDCALNFFDDDHILFGTDMPYGAESGELFVRETIAAVEEVSASDAQRRRKLFEDNARTVLGVK